MIHKTCPSNKSPQHEQNKVQRASHTGREAPHLKNVPSASSPATPTHIIFHLTAFTIIWDRYLYIPISPLAARVHFPLINLILSLNNVYASYEIVILIGLSFSVCTVFVLAKSKLKLTDAIWFILEVNFYLYRPIFIRFTSLNCLLKGDTSWKSDFSCV